MSEAKHTPGDWFHGPTDDTTIYIHSQQGEEDVIFGEVNSEEVPLVQTIANARLIAAASDLLAAAQDWIEWIDAPEELYREPGCGEREERMLSAFRAAIAKATGK